jgi:hypothetical protein
MEVETAQIRNFNPNPTLFQCSEKALEADRK